MAAICGDDILQTDVSVFSVYTCDKPTCKIEKTTKNNKRMYCKAFQFLLSNVQHILYKKNPTMITSTGSQSDKFTHEELSTGNGERYLCMNMMAAQFKWLKYLHNITLFYSIIHLVCTLNNIGINGRTENVMNFSLMFADIFYKM